MDAGIWRRLDQSLGPTFATAPRQLDCKTAGQGKRPIENQASSPSTRQQGRVNAQSSLLTDCRGSEQPACRETTARSQDGWMCRAGIADPNKRFVGVLEYPRPE